MSIPTSTSPDLPLFLGCPVWNCEAWVHSVYPARTPRREWLSWYTRMFNTSEGNSSFYGIPTEEQATRWAEQAAPGFHFCLKFPRIISHDLELQHAEEPTAEFLRVLEILANGNCLGPSFLQLGPRFDPSRSAVLEKYLTQLPSEFPIAVEVRHLAWFDQKDHERRLDDMLRRRQIDRCLFDSRPLFQAPPDDEVERASQSRKPKSPFRTTVTGSHPMVRLVGRNRVELVEPMLQEWVEVTAKWIEEGLKPYFFTHAPDDAFAPEFARLFWQKLKNRLPNCDATLPALEKPPQQLGLFDE